MTTLIYADFQDPNAERKRSRTAPKVRRPTSRDDVRIHPSWRWKGVRVVDFRNKYFLVAGSATARLKGKLETVDLIAAVAVAKDKKAEAFLWPADLQTSGTEEAVKAAAGWIRVNWDGTHRSYKVVEASEKRDDPKWVYDDFEQMVDLAFQDRVISDPNDPLIKVGFRRGFRMGSGQGFLGFSAVLYLGAN